MIHIANSISNISPTLLNDPCYINKANKRLNKPEFERDLDRLLDKAEVALNILVAWWNPRGADEYSELDIYDG